jgi:tRNA pseudouridine38-40 synthase
VRTIQGELERAITQVTQTHATTRGAGRTDAGVHAEGQMVAFDTERDLPPRRWLLALNRYLPDDIAVQAVNTCALGYNPRFDAIDKLYRYLFYLGVARAPLLRDRTWHLSRNHAPQETADRFTPGCKLDLAAMRTAAQALIGTHDFRAFRAADDQRENTLRTLHQVELYENFWDQPNLIALEVRGSAFMKNMVRIIAGTLISVGRGRLSADAVAAQLAPTAVRSRLSETAPAAGLTLVRVTLGRGALQASQADR